MTDRDLIRRMANGITAEQNRAIRYLRNGMATGAEIVSKNTRTGHIIVSTSYGLKLVTMDGQTYNDVKI